MDKNNSDKKKTDETNVCSKGFTRKDFLRGGAAVAAIAVVGGVAACTTTTTITSTAPLVTNTTTTTAPPSTTTVTAPPVTTTVPAVVPDTFLFLNSIESATLQAVCSRIIPSAPGDPGAVEAKAYLYIDHALAGSYSSQQQNYRRGLAAMNAYSQSQFKKNFADLDSTQQDSVLTDMQNGKATGFYGPDSVSFFNTLLSHVREGTFSDPVYGGNQGLVGWAMIGFPGAQVAYGDPDMAVGADQSKKQPMLTLADEESVPMPMPSGPLAGF